MKRRVKLTPRKLPTQERARQTVDAIIEATAYILVERGYGALTTNAVAERAGVNVATLYQYFPNKESIFAELHRRHVKEARGASHEAMAAEKGASFEAMVRASVVSAIAAHRVAPALHRVLTEEAARLGLASEESAGEATQRLAMRVAAKEMRTNAGADLAVWIAGAAVHAVLHQALVERADLLDSPLFANELTRLVVGYLKPQKAVSDK